MKTFAAINVGSYEQTLKIYTITKNNGIREVDWIRNRLDLGGTFATGKLSHEVMDELCAVLRNFVSIMEGYRVDDYRACATSAIRETKNTAIVLDQIMQRMSDHYAKENKMHNTIKSAMMYPIILVILCVAVVIGLFTFIMPTFAGLFTNEEDMPALTRVMMSISNFLRGYWYILIGFVLIAVFGIRYAMKMPNVRLKWDRFIIKGPGFGALVVKIYTARFARTLSSL